MSAATGKRRRVSGAGPDRRTGSPAGSGGGTSRLLASSDEDDVEEDDRDGGGHALAAASAPAGRPSPRAAAGEQRGAGRRRGEPADDTPLIWAQCDLCGKWRSLPLCRSEGELPQAWYCTLNPDYAVARCSAPEEPFVGRDLDGGGGGGVADEVPFRYGIDTLFHVFRHLDLRELCVAHCVSKSWRRAASHPILWKRVRFAAVPAPMWRSLLARMAVAGTDSWDLRGTAASDLPAAPPWPPGGLSSLKHVWLPHDTPVAATVAFTSASPSLESLLVESFAAGASRLNFGHVGSLSSLRTLQLRATHGLELPAFSFTGGTDALGSLANLVTLELTGLRGASAADFQFLTGLAQLRTLALGECNLWDSSAFRALSGLTQLTRLRLEAVSDDPAQPELTACLLSLRALERLDLHLVDPPPDVGSALATLERLRTLVVVPHAGDVWRVPEVQKRCIDAALGAAQITELRIGFVDSDGFGAGGGIFYGAETEMSRSALRHMLIRRLGGATVNMCVQPTLSALFSQADFVNGGIARLPFDQQCRGPMFC